MVCPNCGGNLSGNKKSCEHCGINVALYTKIIQASNHYYNNGLAKAKIRDLTGAIAVLKSCLELNKNHTNARNLLGLIYFEMGEPVAALSEWVISKHLQPENNAADKYIKDIQNNPTKLENLNQAIKKYNTALTYAKQGSTDLALLQLKKVIALNPHSIRANQLVALLYMKNGEHEKAKRYLTKASKIDVSNMLTLRYLMEVDNNAVNKENTEMPTEEEKPAAPIMPVSSYKEDKPNIMAYVNLVLGVIIGIALATVVLFPNISKNKLSESNSADMNKQKEYTEQIAEKDKKIASLETDKGKLDKDMKDLKKQLEEAQKTESVSDIYDSLLSAYVLYQQELEKSSSEQDFTAAADALVAVDETKLESEEARSFYEKLKQEIIPIVIEKYYNEGYDLYNNQKKYEEALDQLAIVLKYDPDNVDAIYFTGRSYAGLGDYEKAVSYYNTLINDYPDTDRAKKAKEKLADIPD